MCTILCYSVWRHANTKTHALVRKQKCAVLRECVCGWFTYRCAAARISVFLPLPPPSYSFTFIYFVRLHDTLHTITRARLHYSLVHTISSIRVKRKTHWPWELRSIVLWYYNDTSLIRCIHGSQWYRMVRAIFSTFNVGQYIHICVYERIIFLINSNPTNFTTLFFIL